MSRLPLSLCPTLSIALALAGCIGSTPPMRWYTLSEVPPAQPVETHGTGAVPLPTRLGPVSMPSELDRQELVTHSDHNQVQVHEFNRWAAPLEGQIRRTLANDLATRARVTETTSAIVDQDAPSAPRESLRTLTISLARLDVDAQCVVSIGANWTIQGGGVQAQSGFERVDQPSAGGECPAAAAATISAALAVLADRLVPFVLRNTPPL